MTGATGRLETQVTTLKPLCSALGSGFSPPLASDLQRPQWLTREKAELEEWKEGEFIVLLFFPHCLTFIYDISSMTGDMA